MNVRLYRAKGPERLAVISVLPASSGTGMLVQVAKGASRAALLDTRLYGPMPREEVSAVVERELASLRAQGFRKSGLLDGLTALESKRRRTRALAAVRLGWLRETAAIEPLLALAAKANEELPVVIDALGEVCGEIGDERALEAVRAAAEKKLLSRRRSGVEALRKLGDPSALADAKNRALERLPAPVVDTLAAAGPLVEAARAVPVKQRGVVLDTLYELGTQAAVDAVRVLVASEAIDAPHLWRYAKSILKRAMLRYDFETFGALAHRIESVARSSKGTVATVKSGFDGTMKETRIFGATTVQYVRRAAWRYLRRLAHHRPEMYALAAAEALVPYAPNDGEAPLRLYGTYSGAYLLNRILFGASGRYVFDGRTLRARAKKASQVKAPPGVREEAYPTLWDLHPEAYLRLLSAAHLPTVHAFAVDAITRAHRDVLERAPHATIVAMMGAPYDPTVDLALAEIRRRFDPERPDWDLLRALLRNARPLARDLGLEWLAATTDRWAGDAARILFFLEEGADPKVRAAVVAHVLAAQGRASPETRRALAEGVMRVLRLPAAPSSDALDGLEAPGAAEESTAEDPHDAHAQMAHALVDILAEIVPVDELLALLAGGSLAAQGVAALTLAARPDSEAVIGRERLSIMAVHPHATVRHAAHAVIARGRDALTGDPSPLYALLDSEWPDARSFAIDLFRTTIDIERLSLDALVGLCDANHLDVQHLGTELVERRMEALPTEELIERLAQHPHRNMRKFVLRLIVEKLKPGFVRLAALEEFFRTILLDVLGGRASKRTAIAFLAARGLHDEHQAEVALRLLGELARSHTRDDFERAITALTRIKIAFPHIEGGITLEAPVDGGPSVQGSVQGDAP